MHRVVGIGEANVDKVGSQGGKDAHRTSWLVNIGLLRNQQLHQLWQTFGQRWRYVTQYILGGERLVFLTRHALRIDGTQALTHGGIH